MPLNSITIYKSTYGHKRMSVVLDQHHSVRHMHQDRVVVDCTLRQQMKVEEVRVNNALLTIMQVVYLTQFNLYELSIKSLRVYDIMTVLSKCKMQYSQYYWNIEIVGAT
jgi:hypothetical protein